LAERERWNGRFMSSESPTARLSVRRAPADGLGDQYPIRLTLDGVPLGVLMPGESVDREVAPGRHRLRGTNTLMRKAMDLELAPGETALVLTRNRSGLGTALFAAFGAGWLYVALERLQGTTR
jgi:hypothetical protein